MTAYDLDKMIRNAIIDAIQSGTPRYKIKIKLYLTPKTLNRLKLDNNLRKLRFVAEDQKYNFEGLEVISDNTIKTDVVEVIK